MKDIKLLKFQTQNCGACKMLEQVMSQVELPTVETIDCEEYPEVAAEYEVFQVPTLVLLNEAGEVIKRHTGFMPKPQLEEWVMNHG